MTHSAERRRRFGASVRRRALGRGRSRRILLALVAPILALVLMCAACTGKTTNGSGASAVANTGRNSTSPSAAASSESAPVPDPIVTITPASAAGLDPVTPITVSVADGTITAVTLVNSEGKAVTGALGAGATSWQNTEDLGYSKTYRLSVAAVNTAGKAVTKDSTFTTLTPGNMTMPYLQRPGGYTLDNGATYGVGIVPVVHFDEQITDRKAAQQALIVNTTPHVDGVWSWIDSQNVHWRPKDYLPTGTSVQVTAKVYGVRVGPGLYGQANQSVTFRIGAKHVSIADDKTHTVKVYFSDKLVRIMPTSMGQGGYVTGTGGQQIALWTMPGTYTVLTHENPAIMSSDSYGLPANSAKGYPPEPVYWATKISVDGIYLHELDTTVWAQGNTDVSHGCLNLNHDNAMWYYQNALVGDVVTVINTGGPGIQVWQNGDWSVPWSTWVRGSAA
ncbi:MAG: Ig-like domain-containing protein [Actinomycetota bacterium]|nr:Ig-like domain-containing protein [Actinomycetota bacterium]